MIYTCTLTKELENIIDGNIVLTEIQDLYKVLPLNNPDTIIFNTDFLDKYFTPTSFANFMEMANKVNSKIEIKVPQQYDSYFIDKVEKILSLRSYEELLDYILEYKNKALKDIHTLGDKYLNNYNETISAANKLANAYMKISELETKLENLKMVEVNTNELLQEANTRLASFKRKVLVKNKINIDEDMFLKLQPIEGKYYKILYLKEISRVKYTDTLIRYLQEIIRTVFSSTMRVIVIEAEGAYSKIDTYHNLVPQDNLTHEDILESDIFMTGIEENVFDGVFRNAKELEFLLILDRTHNDYVDINTIPGVERILIASDINDIKEEVYPDHVITYSKNTLYIPHISGYEDLTSQERITKYSETEIVKSLVNLIKR